MFGDDMENPWRAAGRHIQSVSLAISDLGLPDAGGATTTVDRFLMVAHDTAVEKAYIAFQEVSGTTGQANKGTLVVSLRQTLADGEVREILPAKAIAALTTDPLDLGYARATLKPGRSLFVRLVATPESTTPWWDSGVVSDIYVTLHLLSTR